MSYSHKTVKQYRNRRTVVYDEETLMGRLAVVGQQHNIQISDIWLFEPCSSRFDNDIWQIEKKSEGCLFVPL